LLLLQLVVLLPEVLVLHAVLGLVPLVSGVMLLVLLHLVWGASGLLHLLQQVC
jgi:hypothetical protein